MDNGIYILQTSDGFRVKFCTLAEITNLTPEGQINSEVFNSDWAWLQVWNDRNNAFIEASNILQKCGNKPIFFLSFPDFKVKDTINVIVLGKIIGRAADYCYYAANTRVRFYDFVPNKLGLKFLNLIRAFDYDDLSIDFISGEVAAGEGEELEIWDSPNWSVFID